MQRVFTRQTWNSIGVLALMMYASHSRADACESLASLELSDTTITAAAVVPAGGYTSPKPFSLPIEPSPPYAALPAFCRVAGRIAPVPDSNIGFEVWLPLSNWNSKLVGVGNGSYSGEIWFPSMAAPLAAGYMTASTDTGHAGSAIDTSFALGHPERVVDFGYRAVHQLVVKAKAIAVAFYGRPPRHAYWTGCSTGGRQGLMAAQRFPEDFDGIVAGAPANDMTRLNAKRVSVAQAIHKTSGALLRAEKLPMLHRAVLAACDVLDGVDDDVIENPARCYFDPAALRCAGADAADCLTPAQVASAQTLYAPLISPASQLYRFPGVARGSELGWGDGLGMMVAEPLPQTVGFFRNLVFQKPRWDYLSFDIDRDLSRADIAVGDIVNAVDPNLAPFFDRGGKLLQYHGWADPGIAPQNSIDYFESVRVAVDDEDFDAAYRLFMVPGMDHCAGGAGPDRFDALSALDVWVERGEAPDKIIASRVNRATGAVERTRPLCPYPKVAAYFGEGSTDDAASFRCVATQPQ
jgi:feruloyl esterase